MSDGLQQSFRITIDTDIQFALVLPVTDAHMHIQSNDIAPLSIMFGLLNYKVSSILHKIPIINDTLKSKCNFSNLSYLNNNVSLDEITGINGGGPLLCEFANAKLKVDIGNVIAEFPVLNRVGQLISLARLFYLMKYHFILVSADVLWNLLPSNEIQKMAEKILSLPDEGEYTRLIMTEATVFLNFLLKDYGRITRQNSFFVAGVYKNDVIQSSNMGYNSRSGEGVTESHEERVKLVVARRGQSDFSMVCNHYYRQTNIGFLNIDYLFQNKDAPSIVPSFKLSIVHGMELMYAHYWGIYGIPVYISHNNELYAVVDNLVNPDNDNEKWYNIYDTNTAAINNFVAPLKNGSLNNCPVLDSAYLGINGVKYSHFLKKIPLTEIDQFEHFDKHLEYTKAAVVKYPLEYLPFYHVDPRRFFAPVESISKYHNFYIQNEEGVFEQTNDIQMNIENAGYGKFTYHLDFDSAVKLNLIYKDNGSWNKGLFWGIKMYAALGYPPYLGINENTEAQKAFKCLGDNDYSGLLRMYNFCAEHEVPITCHGSPQGMTIADPGTYFKEFLKANKPETVEKSNFPVNSKSFMYGIGLVDSFSSPASWKLVLDNLNPGNNQKLKLCLAHFGGKKFFTGEWDDSAYYWLDDIAKLTDEFDGVYTDISCFTYDSFVSLPQKIPTGLYNAVKNKMPDDTKEHIDGFYKKGFFCYDQETSTESFSNYPEQKRKMALLRLYLMLEYPNYTDELECYKNIYITATKLSELLKSHGNRLRHRILYGTDWPMSEMETEGVSKYNSAMFVLLQLVTVFLDNEWDVWHQFAVINPLRFLGLLENPDNNLDEYQMNLDKITAMKDAIAGYYSSIEMNDTDVDKYQKDYVIGTVKSTTQLNFQYQYLTNIAQQLLKIPSAAKMTDVNDNLILTAMPKGTKII